MKNSNNQDHSDKEMSNLNQLEAELKTLQPSAPSSDFLQRMEQAMQTAIEPSSLEDIEQTLQKLNPVPLEEKQAEQLEQSMDLVELEALLHTFSPQTMPKDLLTRMETSMQQWQEPSNARTVITKAKKSETKVLPFPSNKQTPTKTKRTNKIKWQSMAAALVITSVAAFLFAQPDQANTLPKEQLASQTLQSQSTTAPSPAISTIPKTATATANIKKPLPEAPTEAIQISDIPRSTLGHNIVQTSNEGIVTRNNQAYRLLRLEYEEVTHFKNKNGTEYETRTPKVRYVLIKTEVN